MADVLTHHTNMGIPGHLLVDGFTECIEEKRPCHGVVDIPAMPASAAKLSQPVLIQPPAANVVSSRTDNSNPGESRSTSRPRSWGVMRTGVSVVPNGLWQNPRQHLAARL